jgi:hypothetical protein
VEVEVFPAKEAVSPHAESGWVWNYREKFARL